MFDLNSKLAIIHIRLPRGLTKYFFPYVYTLPIVRVSSRFRVMTCDFQIPVFLFWSYTDSLR